MLKKAKKLKKGAEAKKEAKPKSRAAAVIFLFFSHVALKGYYFAGVRDQQIHGGVQSRCKRQRLRSSFISSISQRCRYHQAAEGEVTARVLGAIAHC